MAAGTVERMSARDDKQVRFGGSGGPPPGRLEGAYEPLLHEPPPLSGSEGQPTAAQYERNSLLAAGTNLAKTILGVGLLALPRVFALLGIGTATIWLIFTAALTYLSMHMLTKATVRTGLLNYSDVVREQLGIFGQTVLDLAVIINCFGMQLIYLVVIGDILVGTDGAEGLLSQECGNRRTVLAMVTVLLLAPMVSATRTGATTGASTLGVAAVLIWAVVTLLLFLLAASNGELQLMHWWPHSPTFKGKGFESAVQMVAVLPILVVAYLCQMSLGHTVRDLTYVRERQVDNVSIVALSLSTVAFLTISICSYGIFGKNLHPDILRNFTVKALSPLVWTRLAQAGFMLVRLGFLVSLLATFPLQMGPFRDSLWKLLFRQQLQGPGLWLVTYLSLGGVYWAAAYLTTIWEPLIVLGSTAGVLIAFIFPGLLGASLEEDITESAGARRTRGVLGYLLAAVGVVIGVAGLCRVAFYKDPISD